MNDLNNMHKNECYCYTVLEERKLLSAINSGDKSKVCGIISEIYAENFEKRDLDSAMAKCLLNNMLGTIINVINNNEFGKSDESLAPVSVVHRMYECNSADEMKEVIKESALACAEYIGEKTKNKRNNRTDDIIAFVDAHYTDYSLTCTSVADKFGVSPAAVSKIFKREVDMGVNEYINLLRLNKACNLLENTDMTIHDIAENVGCGNYRTFARLFVNHYGVTAKDYREIYK